MQMSGLLDGIAVRGMLQGKDYRAVDMVLLVVRDYTDIATRFGNGTRMTVVY